MAEWGGYDPIIREFKPFILESFYYCDADTERLLPYFGDFLLDSGAFTLRQNIKGNIDWEEYIDQYADFINRNNIQKFFELDIDNLVGLSEVKRLRKQLECKTQKQCITVWHPSRGWDDFVGQSKERPYISLGGIVGASKTEKLAYQKTFPKFIYEAHKNGAKIHGLALRYTASPIDYADGFMHGLFALNLRISISSSVMYIIANFADIYLYNFIRRKMNGKAVWFRNNVSTILTNCLENFGFIALAFWEIYSAKDIITIAISTSIMEVIVAICDTPFLYMAKYGGIFEILTGYPKKIEE